MRPGLVVLLAAGCGLGGASGGGSANLPISGAGPYDEIADPARTTPLDEPFVVIDPDADLADPAPLALPGGAIRLFFTRGGTEIWRADVPGSLMEPAGAPTRVLTDAAAPALVADGAALQLYYQNAAGIARATSSDGGESFVPDEGVLVAGATQPGAARAGGRFYLYYTRPGARAIFAATSDDGVHFVEAGEPALRPRPGSFDAADVGEPSAVGAVTEAGELHVGLFYVGTSDAGVAAIGYAGSFDGTGFTAAAQPILDPLAPSEHGPGALVASTHSVLFFTQDRAGRSAIAAATSP